MSDTTLSVVEVAAPPSPPVVEEAAPETAPQTEAPAEEAAPSDAPQSDEETYEQYLERVEANENWKAADGDRLKSKHDEGYEAARTRFQPLYDRAKSNSDRTVQLAEESRQGIEHLFQTVARMEQSGIVNPGDFAAAIAKHAPGMVASLANIDKINGWNDGQAWLMHTIDPKAYEAIHEKFSTARMTGAGSEDIKLVAQDWIDSVVAEREKSAEDRGYRRGLKDRTAAATTAAKATTRNGSGPDTASGTTGGSKPYTKMSTEERSKLSPSERDAAIAAELRG